MPKLYWKDIEIGDPIPPLTRAALTRSEMVTFAVVAQESSQLHLDEEFARQAGYGSISAPGLLGMALASQTVEQWLENGRVIGIATRFQKLIWPGDVLTAKGVVVRKYEASGQHRIDCDVWVQNQANDIVLKGTATCQLFFDSADERKKRGKHMDANITIPPMPRPVAPPPSAPRPEIVAANATARPHGAPVAKGTAKSQPPPLARPAAPGTKPLAKPVAPPAVRPLPVGTKSAPVAAKKLGPTRSPAHAFPATKQPPTRQLAKKQTTSSPPARKAAKSAAAKKAPAKKQPAKKTPVKKAAEKKTGSPRRAAPSKKPSAKGKSKK